MRRVIPTREGKGATLIEMTVAVAVSTTFILLISAMLSQILRLSTATQNQLIASSAAELLIENVKQIPWEILSNNSQIVQDSEYDLVVNKLSDSNFSYPFRTIPVQLDLVNGSKIYGAVGGSDGSYEPGKKWSDTTGNFFRGKAKQTITDATLKAGGLPAVEVNISIQYASTEGGGTKTLKRNALIFKDGAPF